MKKILSLAIFIATTSVFAQPYTETFDNANLTGGSYTNGSFVGVQEITYFYKQSRAESVYAIDNEGLMFKDKTSELEVEYPNGLSQFSFQYRKAFNNDRDRALDILINGTLVETTDIFGTNGANDDEVYTYTLSNDIIVGTTEQEGTNKEEPITVTIRISASLSGNRTRQTVIDNIVWAPYDEAVSVKSNEIEGLQVYPNPATNVVNISSDANALKEVAIFDLTGKKVLETETMNNVNVSSLNAGVYMLQVEENGKKSSRKLVIK